MPILESLSDETLRANLVTGKSVLIRNQWWTIKKRDLDAGKVVLAQSEWAIKDGNKKQADKSMTWGAFSKALQAGTYGVKINGTQHGPSQDRESRNRVRVAAGHSKAPKTEAADLFADLEESSTIKISLVALFTGAPGVSYTGSEAAKALGAKQSDVRSALAALVRSKLLRFERGQGFSLNTTGKGKHIRIPSDLKTKFKARDFRKVSRTGNRRGASPFNRFGRTEGVEYIEVLITEDEATAWARLLGLTEQPDADDVGREMGSGKHALHTNKTGEKFWGNTGAGILPLCPASGRMLLGKRSSKVNEPNTWGVFGGAVDAGENPMVAAKREVAEELRYKGTFKIKKAFVFTSPGGGFVYHNFLGIVEQEFEPHLDWENSAAKWLTMSQALKLKSRWHFGFEGLWSKSKNAIKKILAPGSNKKLKRSTNESMDTTQEPLDEATDMQLQVWPKGAAATDALKVNTSMPLKNAARDVASMVKKYKPAWRSKTLHAVQYDNTPLRFAFSAGALTRIKESMDEGAFPRMKEIPERDIDGGAKGNMARKLDSGKSFDDYTESMDEGPLDRISGGKVYIAKRVLSLKRAKDDATGDDRAAISITKGTRLRAKKDGTAYRMTPATKGVLRPFLVTAKMFARDFVMETLDVDAALEGQSNPGLVLGVLADELDEMTRSGSVGGFSKAFLGKDIGWSKGGPGGGPPLNSPFTLKGKKNSPKAPVDVAEAKAKKRTFKTKSPSVAFLRLRSGKPAAGTEMMIRKHGGRMGSIDGHSLPVHFTKEANRKAFLATLAQQNDPTVEAVSESLMVLSGLALSTLIGIPVGRGVIKAIRTVKKLLDLGKTSAAEKAWDKISSKDTKAVVQWAKKHNKGKLPKRRTGGGAVRPSFEDVHIPADRLDLFLETATRLGIPETVNAHPHPEGGLLVTLSSAQAEAVGAALGEALRVDDVSYRNTHGKPPRGSGNWAFAFDGKTDSNDVWFAPRNTPYAAAKKAAIAQAKKIHATSISTQS